MDRAQPNSQFTYTYKIIQSPILFLSENKEFTSL